MRAGDRAEELAKAYGSARIAGQQCEKEYGALLGKFSVSLQVQLFRVEE
jgi:hypothetical protein